MRNELAERLLSRVMRWDTPQVRTHIPDLQAMSMVKYDEYGNYGPGSKFVENLAAWLNQFPDDRKQVALEFVLNDLVFVSETQMSHLITLVAPEIIAPVLRERVATAQSISNHRIAEIERHPDFRRLRRSSLIIGMSDGARLDRLRRSSGLSHEQFVQGTKPGIEELEGMAKNLAMALSHDGPERPSFRHLFLVDDFSGSGRTLIREEENGLLDGKLIRLRKSLADAVARGYIDDGVSGTVVLYCVSEQAEAHIRGCLEKGGFAGWDVRWVQRLHSSLRVDATNPDMTQLCHKFADPSTEDTDKARVPQLVGFGGGG